MHEADRSAYKNCSSTVDAETGSHVTYQLRLHASRHVLAYRGRPAGLKVVSFFYFFERLCTGTQIEEEETKENKLTS